MNSISNLIAHWQAAARALKANLLLLWSAPIEHEPREKEDESSLTAYRGPFF